MSIESTSPQGSGSTDISDAPCKDTATQATSSDVVSNTPLAEDPQQSQSGSGSLLASLWSPFSSMLHSSSLNKNEVSTDTNKDTSQPTSEQSKSFDTKGLEEEKEPEPYYMPKSTPTFKRLARLRLSGTREKQLIRAASRPHNDPPPPPGLGLCCGSSCDPCVNELWRQERDTWRERWGDHAIEDQDTDQDKKKNLEW